MRAKFPRVCPRVPSSMRRVGTALLRSSGEIGVLARAFAHPTIARLASRPASPASRRAQAALSDGGRTDCDPARPKFRLLEDTHARDRAFHWRQGGGGNVRPL